MSIVNFSNLIIRVKTFLKKVLTKIRSFNFKKLLEDKPGLVIASFVALILGLFIGGTLFFFKVFGFASILVMFILFWKVTYLDISKLKKDIQVVIIAEAAISIVFIFFALFFNFRCAFWGIVMTLFTLITVLLSIMLADKFGWKREGK